MSAKTIRFLGNYDVNAQGKFLWEILAQLRNFGVGRMVTKNEWGRKWPDQPSYLLIRETAPEMDRWLSRGRLWADWTYRGMHLGVFQFEHDLNRSDWRLIHKHEEAEFKKSTQKMQPVTFPDTFPIPPLQVLLAEKAAARAGKADCSVPTRAPLQLCVDPEFEMIRHMFKQAPADSPASSIYDEVDPNELIDLYGKELPVKVDAWIAGPAQFIPRWNQPSSQTDTQSGL